jgi:hypothetical protein
VVRDGLEVIEIVRAIRPDVFIAEEQRAIFDIAGCVRGYGGRTVVCSMNDKNAYTEIENGYSQTRCVQTRWQAGASAQVRNPNLRD